MIFICNWYVIFLFCVWESIDGLLFFSSTQMISFMLFFCIVKHLSEEQLWINQNTKIRKLKKNYGIVFYFPPN